tara:strand:+ start:800 stop:1051 length:252 start_codon:yes stop_codon:yes gene_type:complete
MVGWFRLTKDAWDEAWTSDVFTKEDLWLVRLLLILSLSVLLEWGGLLPEGFTGRCCGIGFCGLCFWGLFLGNASTHNQVKLID